MSPDATYIVVINEFYAYQVTVDMNVRNAAITEAILLHNKHLKSMVDGLDIESQVLDIRVYQKIN